MANKTLFGSPWRRYVAATDTLNAEGAPAYSRTAKQALAHLAVTGCLNDTFYANAEAQLEDVLAACEQVDSTFLAQCAIYARQQGFMKDLPALLAAVLAVREGALLEHVFPRVVDNGRMLRNFVQILRSGALGRRSLGSRPKRLVQQWLESRSVTELLRDSVGTSPSLADIIKMVHPKPASPERAALYGYLIGRPVDVAELPALVRELLAFRQDGGAGRVPDVPFQLLTSMELSREQWTEVALRASWQTLRMNLNTFLRHGVFTRRAIVAKLAKRLADRKEVDHSRVFPYQLLAAWKAADPGLPSALRKALLTAMEHATRNVPRLHGSVVVCPDVSGSMASPVTGYRRGSTSAVRCVDVAALVAASLLRVNPGAMVLPFETDVVSVRLDPSRSVFDNAKRLAAIRGGGTCCSAPLRWLNERREHADLVVFVSDNQSWVEARGRAVGAEPTAMMREWARFRARNPGARLVCIDIQPYTDHQVTGRDGILCVSGFSDAVFRVLATAAEGDASADHWVETIERAALS